MPFQSCESWNLLQAAATGQLVVRIMKGEASGRESQKHQGHWSCCPNTLKTLNQHFSRCK